MIKLRYFKDQEFANATPACSLLEMDEEFMSKLDDARSICSVPFKVNSAYRTIEYERSKGRSGSSSHCKGIAIDLECITPSNRLKMLLALLAVGFRRIGLYPTFIHVDSDTSKPACVWIGK